MVKRISTTTNLPTSKTVVPRNPNHASSSLNIVKKLAVKQGVKCISTEYVNNRSWMMWQCKAGHTWKATFFNVGVKKPWCPHCAQETPGPREWDAQFVASVRGGKCLSDVCRGLRSALLWECSEGHTWQATLTCVKNNGTWCPRCAQATPGPRLCDAQFVASAHSGKCLSDTCRTVDSTLLWECNEGHTWEATFNSVKNNGTWCPTCSRKNSRLSLKDAIHAALKMNGMCLSEHYVNFKAPLDWQCAKGHRWTTSLKNIRHKRSWCPSCSMEVRRTKQKV